MRRKHSESSSTRETEKAREDEEEEEGSGKQREVLLCPVMRGGSVMAKPNRKHRRTDKRMESRDKERPEGTGERNQTQEEDLFITEKSICQSNVLHQLF